MVRRARGRTRRAARRVIAFAWAIGALGGLPSIARAEQPSIPEEVRYAKERGDELREAGKLSAAGVAYTDAYELLRARLERDESSAQLLVELAVDAFYRAYRSAKDESQLCRADAILRVRLDDLEGLSEGRARRLDTEALLAQIEAEEKLLTAKRGVPICESPDDGGRDAATSTPEIDNKSEEPASPTHGGSDDEPAAKRAPEVIEKPVYMAPVKPPPSLMLKAGIGSTVTGFGALGIGIALWAVKAGCAEVDDPALCPDAQEREGVRVAGYVLIGVGAAAAGVGLSLILVDYYRMQKRPVKVAPIVGSRGGGIVLRGRF